jgi:hypothetical protein
MVISYKIKKTEDNEVAQSEVSASKTDTTPPKISPTMVAEEFPTPQVSTLQLYVTFSGNGHGTEYYNDLFHLNRLATDD